MADVTSTDYYRVKKLGLENTKGNRELAAIAFDPVQVIVHLKRYVELRVLLNQFGLNSKGDLQALLDLFRQHGISTIDELKDRLEG